ncbi:leucyl aminopeptidase [Raineyella fluvialis]|uniref:Probable cytosol aminopeptidase n=1 Tax=Raineyella fluvialis TaxID=2662261 RepID=A0A5Q2FHQ7_9ACTN|nr:leucyl aminopeptidase [Raineyella fluvialis]QGF24195.1 leucyl aminopeptidase [Raineyella fluvialis]
MNITTLPQLRLAEDLPDDIDYLVVGTRLVDDRGLPHGLPDGVETTALDLDLLGVGAKSRTSVGSVTPLGRLAGGTRVVAVGLGKDLPTAEVLRRAAGAAVRAICATVAAGDEVAVAVSLHEDALSLPISVFDTVRAIAEGALLGTYEPVHAVGDIPAAKVARVVVLDSDPEAHDSALRLAAAVTRAVARARDWVNTPANVLFPESFAAAVTDWFAGAPVELTVRDEDQLAAEGFGGVLAVGGGSVHPPRVVRAAYSPAGASQKLVLVGKGMTFDAGGLDIKPAGHMLTMKCDMGGAAAVMAATRAIADLGLQVEVVAYAGMAENLPSGSAYRPSDVLTMHDGTTVEVTNTDAEGRLVLADCLSVSQADDADLVVDIATLTGACMRALGLNTIGLVASSDQVAGRLLHAAERSGEAMWQMPLTDEARDKLTSPYADMASANTDGYLGMQVAAAFLEHFAGERHWAHLDIAGPAWREGTAEGYLAIGGTGAGVRTLVDLALTME